jgi:hypothetical protein
MMRSGVALLPLAAATLMLGMAIYHWVEGLSWSSAFLNAAMLLGVLRADNTKIVLRNPSVIGDSLVAMDAADRRFAIPLTQVKQVEVEKTDGGKVTFVVVGSVAGAVLLVYLFANSVANAAY